MQRIYETERNLQKKFVENRKAKSQIQIDKGKFQRVTGVTKPLKNVEVELKVAKTSKDDSKDKSKIRSTFGLSHDEDRRYHHEYDIAYYSKNSPGVG